MANQFSRIWRWLGNISLMDWLITSVPSLVAGIWAYFDNWPASLVAFFTFGCFAIALILLHRWHVWRAHRLSQSLEGWSQVESLTLAQAACLFVGISPPDGASVPDKAAPALEQLKQCVRNETLPTTNLMAKSPQALADKMARVASGRQIPVSAETVVRLDDLCGLIDPTDATPKFLLGNVDD